MKNQELLELGALILVIIGGVNLGLMGLSNNFSVIAAICGGMSIITRLIYVLIGVSGCYLAYLKVTKM